MPFPEEYALEALVTHSDSKASLACELARVETLTWNPNGPFQSQMTVHTRVHIPSQVPFFVGR